MARQCPKITPPDSEYHGRFRITRQLNNRNQTLTNQQGWADGWSTAHTNGAYGVEHHNNASKISCCLRRQKKPSQVVKNHIKKNTATKAAAGVGGIPLFCARLKGFCATRTSDSATSLNKNSTPPRVCPNSCSSESSHLSSSVFIPIIDTIQQDFRWVRSSKISAGDDSAQNPPLWSVFFFFYLSNVTSDRMPRRVSNVHRAQGASYEQDHRNLAYIRNHPNLAYIWNRNYCFGDF